MTSEAPGPSPRTSNYKGNSKLDKEIAEEEAMPKLKKIAGLSVKEAKPSIGKRIKDSFGGQTLKGVGMYLLIDVVIPNTRDLLYDLATEGAHRSIYGEAPSRRKSAASTALSNVVGNTRARQTSYNTMSQSSVVTNRVPGDTSIASSARSGFDFSLLTIANRDQAMEIIENMREAIDQFTTVNVADLYDLLEITGNGFTDQKFGWDAQAFQGAKVLKTRDGWVLDLPEPIGLV